MRRLSLLLLFSVLGLFAADVHAQTTLSRGDLAVIGIDTDDEEFAFVTLVALDAGTEIFFSDEEASGSSIGTGEGILKYTAPASVSAGTVIVGGPGAANFTEEDSGFILGNSGDGVVAFQGYNSGTGAVTTFLFAIGEDAGDIGTPSGITAADQVLLGNDNGDYNGSRSDTKATLYTEVADASNYTKSGSALPAFNTTSFAISGGGSGDSDTEVEDPTTQVAAATIVSTVDTQGEAQDVFAFDIADQGTADGEATQVTNIRLKPNTPTNTADLTDNIAGVTLTGSTLGVITTSSVTITDAAIDIAITAGDLDVGDGATETITVAVFLTDGGTVDDGATLQLFVDADASGFTAEGGTTSTFQNPFTGGDVISNSFTLTVDADRLVFNPDPPSGGDVGVGNDFSVIVDATDVNGNVDEDETSTVTLARGAGTGTLSATGGLSQALAAGTVTFTAQYDTAESFTISTSNDGGLTNTTSQSITATNTAAPAAGVVFISEVSEGDGSSTEYIEFYNSSSTVTADFGTAKLVRADNGGSSEYVFDFESGDAGSGTDVTIPPLGFLVVARGATEATFEAENGALPGNANYLDGNSNLFFGTGSPRRWILQVGGTANTDDGTVIDDTESSVAGSGDRTVQISDGVFATEDFADRNPGALDSGQNFGAVTAVVDGDSGWRMLAAPETGFTVASLNAISLVQGVAESFPGSDDNVFTYDGTFNGAASTGDALTSGQGFIWYLWDNTDGGSQAFPVTLSSSGTAPNSDVTTSFNAQTDVLAGNPFRSGIDVGEITVADGTIQNDISVWNPDAAGPDANGNTGTYETVSRSGNEVVAPWQGFWAETADGATSITIPRSAAIDGGGTFQGKRAEGAVARLRFALDGDGVADYATSLVVAEDATLGYDIFDLTKLTPLATSYVALAFGGEKNGAQVMKATESVPSGSAEALALPLNLDAVGFAGSLTLTWTPAEAALPNGWAFALVDNVTGDEVDLLTAERYTFEVGSASSKQARTWQDVATQARHLKSAEARFTLKVIPAGAVANEDVEGFDGPVLEAAYPNPSAGSTTLRYSAPSGSTVELVAFDMLGRRVALVASGTGIGAEQTATFDAGTLPAGLYVVRLSVDGAPRGTQTVTVVR